MKKEFKKSISKLLAGTMLITSSFAGVWTVNAADEISYDFEDLDAGYVVGTDTGADYYMNMSIVDETYGVGKMTDGTDIGTDNKVADGPIHAYVVEKDGNKYVRIADANAASPKLSFNVSSVKGDKVTYSVDFMAEKTASSFAPVALEAGGKTVLSIASGADAFKNAETSAKFAGNYVNDVASENGTAGSPSIGPFSDYLYVRVDKDGSKYFYYDEENPISYAANKWYTVKVVVDTTANTADVTIDDTVIVEGFELTDSNIDTLAICGSGSTSRMLNVDNVKAASAENSGSDDENTSGDPVTTGGGVDDDDVTTGDPITTESAIEFTFTKGLEITIDAKADGTVTVTGDAVKSYYAETKTITLKSDSDLTMATLFEAMKSVLSGFTVESGSEGIVVTDSNDENKTIAFKVVKEDAPTPDDPETVDKTYDISGTVGETVPTAASDESDFYTDGAVGTYTENGINITGSGKMFVKFPATYSKNVVTFSSDVILSEGYKTSSTAVFEIWGTVAGAPKDVVAAKSNNGKWQLKNSVGSNIDTNVDVKTGEKVNVKIVIDLDKDVAELYIDGVKIATDEGAISLSGGIDTIESVDSAAFFVRDTASQEVSAIKLAVTEENTNVDDSSSSSSSTETPVESGAISVERTAVGDADVNNLKIGDQVDVTYKLTDVSGINNFTFYVDFDPAVLEFNSAQTVDEANAVTYKIGDTVIKLIPEELIEKQAAIVPALGDADYDAAKAGPADGVKTANQLGRIKLAGVAGLDDSSTATTDTDGILFTIRFTVKGEGTSNVGLSPVGDAAGAADIFYGVPESGKGAEPIEVGSSIPEEEVSVPTVVTAPEFTFDDLGVKIVIDAEGKLTVTGAEFETATKTITLSAASTATVESLIKAIADKATADGLVVSSTETTVTITDKDDAAKTITFTVSKEQGTQPPTPAGEVEVTVDGNVIGFAVGVKGLEATVEKGSAIETEGGAIVPYVGEKSLKDFTVDSFAVENATVKGYDAATFTLTLTIDGKDYSVEFFVYGDVTGDGLANVGDALKVVDYNNKVAEFTDKQSIAGDVTGDGLANVGDALKIVDYNNKVITEFPVVSTVG